MFGLPEWSLWTAGGIIASGGLICLILILRSKFVGKKHIEEYKEERNKLTQREDEKIDEDEDEGGGGGIISSLIGGFVVILMGAALIKPIAEQVNFAANQTGVNEVLHVIPTFFVMGLIGIAIAITYAALRRSGVL